MVRPYAPSTRAVQIRQSVTMDGDRRSARRRLLAHLAVVMGLLSLFAVLVAATPPDAGANIGAGIVGLPLLALGMPWSLPILIDPYRFDQWSDAAHYVLWFGPALLNVALHAVAVAVWNRRRRA